MNAEQQIAKQMGRKLPMYIAPDLCGPCGGKCCKGMPGSTHPEDWGAPDRAVMVQRLAEAFRSGLWAIDWWEGDPREYSERRGRRKLDRAEYVRPAIRGEEHRLYHGAWGGECTLLTPTGCSLKHDDRPYNCRALEPRPDVFDGCTIKYGTKLDMVIAWIPYRDVIAKAASMVER